ncbi:GGDEF domain-containing protein [Rhodoferax saidenbachensis]|uniref:diguanylate cyclase n=1 Tax=Rhodoferax saidenbachensis TaxID=1484693 RepID=A0A1P8KG82_9BURK|nr:GGDEF domain-containing protein [Rhodoferax saidenbachensis]
MLVQIAFTLLTTGLLISAALYTDSLKEQRLWAMGNIASCLGLALGAATGLPDLVHACLSYGVMGLGLALILRGLRIFGRQELGIGWMVGIVLVPLAVTAYFTLVQPSLPARLALTGMYFGVLNWVCAATLLRHGNGHGVSVTVVGFVALGVSLFVRGGYLLVNPQASDQAAMEIMNFTLFVIPLGQVCVMFGLILMVVRRYAERLRMLSTIDALTGALNRAALELQGQRIMQRARQGLRSVAVVMIDADHFKQINDSFGHPVGDEVLRHLSVLLMGQLRPNDLLARYGGEEFVLVLDGLNSTSAVNVAERLRQLVEQATVTAEGQSVRYTVSMGVTSSGIHGYNLMQLISAADAAMYEAKRAGRNRVHSG